MQLSGSGANLLEGLPELTRDRVMVHIADVIKQVPLYSEMHRFIPAMASIAGPRIAEIKVRHHARQFGESKYGLSRVYKVLLDLLTIKTIAGFSSRPLRWFALLAIPFLMLSMALFTGGVVAILMGARSALPMTGSSLFFGSLGIYLLFSGGLAELINRTGDTNVANYPLLTAVEIDSDDPGSDHSSQGNAQ